MIERRSSERFAKALPLYFSNSEKEYKGVSLDFSTSGLFILTTEPFKPGTDVRIQLKISEKESIHLRGVVARTIKTGDINIKNGMGVKFNEAPYAYHKYLGTFEE